MHQFIDVLWYNVYNIGLITLMITSFVYKQFQTAHTENKDMTHLNMTLQYISRYLFWAIQFCIWQSDVLQTVWHIQSYTNAQQISHLLKTVHSGKSALW